MSEQALPFKENKMGVMPVNKLLLTMSIPMILSMLTQALYNIVDSIFVARLNENALIAVTLAFPMQFLMIAIASGTGVGINALLSRSLGERKQDRVNKAANNGVLLAFVSSLIFLVFGLFFARVYFARQTADAEIIRFGTDYLSICTIGAFALFGQVVFERLLQSTGKTIYSMITQSTGALTNIILDPILIFGLFGFPRLEVAGAAIATVIGQFMALLLALYFNMTKNHEIQFHIKAMKPHRKTILRIYKVGIPSILMMSIGSVMTYFMNKILITFTTTANAVFGAYFRLQSFIIMPIIGLTNGMIPIIAYNFGARNKKRIIRTTQLGILYAVAIMLFGLAVFQIFPMQLLQLFDASAEMIKIGIPALRVISLHFIFAGYCIVAGAVFQALGNGIFSLCVSAGRQLVALLPAAWLLSALGGLSAVWWAFPIAEIVSVCLSSVFLLHVYRKEIKPL